MLTMQRLKYHQTLISPRTCACDLDDVSFSVFRNYNVTHNSDVGDTLVALIVYPNEDVSTMLWAVQSLCGIIVSASLQSVTSQVKLQETRYYW